MDYELYLENNENQEFKSSNTIGIEQNNTQFAHIQMINMQFIIISSLSTERDKIIILH